ncbi:MAG: hypothetical protein AAGA87_12095 [Pseudomonadota bacterium]
MKLLPLALILTLTAGAAQAICLEGMKCITIESFDDTAPYAVGETLPRGKYRVLLNTTYHGLPASDGTFWYFRVGRHVLQVDSQSMEVLADVTRKARRLTRQ